jgi:hypothetical protein
MEETLKALLEEYFSKYTTYQNLINTILLILIGASNILIGHLLTKRIEKVKLKNSQELSSFSSELNLLNRKSEIKFQKYQLEQADAIKELYSILIDVNYSTNSLLKDKFKSNPHNEFKNKLIKWGKNYMIFHRFFNKNKILYNQHLLDLTKDHFNSLQEIFSIVFKKINDIEELENCCQGQLEYVYNDQEEETIIADLNKLKEDMDVKVRDFKFKNLRTELENEYRRLLE